MKCDARLLGSLVLLSPMASLWAANLGDLADNISPLLFFGSDMAHLLLAFLSFIFFVYTFSLWTHYRKNPAFTPLTAVLTSLLVAISCAAFAYWNHPGHDQRSPVISQAPDRSSVTQKSKPASRSQTPKKQQNRSN